MILTKKVRIFMMKENYTILIKKHALQWTLSISTSARGTKKKDRRREKFEIEKGKK